MLQEVSMRAPGRRQAELTAALDVGSRDEDISHCEPGSSSIESSSSVSRRLRHTGLAHRGSGWINNLKRIKIGVFFPSCCVEVWSDIVGLL